MITLHVVAEQFTVERQARCPERHITRDLSPLHGQRTYNESMDVRSELETCEMRHGGPFPSP